MARAIWNGAVSFGLVNVPVQLVTAVRDLTVRFHELDEKSKARIEIRRVCSKENKKVEYEELAHGYEVDGECVMLTDEELEALEPRRTKTIDVEAFVDLDEIDPAYFDHPYYLLPAGGEGGARAYRLLADVMERSGRVALGRFVLRTREHLVALRVRDRAITLSTMLFENELRRAKDLGAARVTGKDKPSTKAVGQATKLVEALKTDFDPGAYEDRHRKRVERLIAKKRKGGEISMPSEPETPEAPPDLIAALEESLRAVRSG
ncbi:MAG TPA: Ku protein [Solirubrobacteraceae bacterium]